MRCSIIVILSLFAVGCGEIGPPPRQVVVYTSHDQILSEPILDLFTEQTGIEVLAQYDTEATKTTGLVNRIIAEAARPRCDVFWNNEIVQTIRLQERGLTQAYRSPAAEGIPNHLRDLGGHWTGFAARARVVVFHTGGEAPPESVARYDDIFMGSDPTRAGLALPLFGTTATHLALLCAQHGEDATRAWLLALRENGVQVLDSNGQVCDAVARGALKMGWTDTDDVAVAISEGQPIVQVIPDEGAILIPNTVAMIAGAPHPEEAQAFIDFLLSRDVERRLAEGIGAQIPLHAGVESPENVLSLSEIEVQEIDWAAVAASFDTATALVNEVLVEGN